VKFVEPAVGRRGGQIMRKLIVVAGIAGALTFGTTGVAHAGPVAAPAPSTTTTVVAQNEQVDSGDNGDDGGDNTGLWGLAGLLGLLGLLGLRRPKTAPAPGPTGYGQGPAPRS